MNVLSDSQITNYRTDGFLIVHRVFEGPEVQQLREESDRVWKLMDIDKTNRRIQWRNRVDGGKTADRIDPVLDIAPRFDAAARDPRITNPVGQLLDCEKPVIFKSKLISKWPQTTGYALHQDYTYWPGLGDASPDDFVTAMIALDAFENSSGALELFPGVHHHRLMAPAENPKDVAESEVDLSTMVRANLNPGDAVFFHGMTPHRSGPNLSQNNRQSLFFTYVTPGHEDLTQRYYAERPTDFMDPL